MLGWILEAFLFTYSNSPLRILDPRIRVLLTIELFTLSALPNVFVKAAILLAMVLILGMIGNVFSKLLKAMIFAGIFSIIIGAIDFYVNTDPIRALGVSMRFLGIVGSLSIFFLTTSPDELGYVMKRFRVHRDIIFAFLTAMRFVPVLLLDISQIIDAQRSRGLEIQKGNIVRRVNKLFPLVVPMVSLVLERSNHLAEAMESRAYGSVKQVSSFKELRFRPVDRIFLAISTPLMVLAFYFVLTF